MCCQACLQQHQQGCSAPRKPAPPPAKQLILDVIKSYEQIFKDPEPFVKVGELADSSVNFTVRVWTKSEDYWDVYFGLTEDVKKAMDKAGISIPFPQQDVHMHQAS